MKKLPPDGRQSVAQGRAHRLGQGHHQAEVTQALPHAVPGDELAGVGGVQYVVDGEEHAVPARRNTQNGLAMAKAWPSKNRA